MATFVPPKKNTAYTFYIGLVSQADTKLMQVNPTLAAGDVKVAIDDGAPANLGTLPVVDADFTKRVKVVMSAAEMNGDNITVIFNDAAGAEWCDLEINFQTVATSQIDDLATVAALTTVQADTDDIQARLPAALTAEGNIKADALRVSGTLQTAGDLAALLTIIDDFLDTEIAAIKAKTDNLPENFKKNTAFNNFTFPMLDSTTEARKTGVAVTGQRSIDGAAFAALANAVTEIGTTGVYKVNLAAADLNGDAIELLFTGTGAKDMVIFIKTTP